MDFDYARYLVAKRTVDDRALQRVVLEALRSELAGLGDRPLRVLELGAGVGTMPRRLFEWQVLARAHYTLLDGDAASLHAARAQLEPGARQQPACPFRFEYVHRDLFAFLALPEAAEGYDLVIANAVLDLVDLERCLPLIWRVLGPGRPFWFSINFDGDTIFVPEHPLDAQVLELYHRSMDQRVRDGQPAGHSRTGRRLLQLIPASGATLVAAGSSDWVVWPTAGAYPGDEAYFLHHIVHTIDGALRGQPALDASALRAWVTERHAQIDRGELCYVAHQLDVMGRAPRRGSEL